MSNDTTDKMMHAIKIIVGVILVVIIAIAFGLGAWLT